MQGARRTAVLAVLAVLGGLILTGCRSQPAVAAYVGGVAISNAEVERIVQDARTKVERGELGSEVHLDFAVLRTRTVEALITRELIRQLARDTAVTLPTPDYAGFASANQLPPTFHLTRLLAEAQTDLTEIAKKASPFVPTDADRKDAFDRTTINGQSVTNPFDTVKQFFDTPEMRQALGTRELLRVALKRHPVDVNPLYGPIEIRIPFPIQDAQSYVAVPLGSTDSTPAVVDRR
jgi:hypothetical protein